MSDAPWKCCGCGKESPGQLRNCDCPTACLYQPGGGSALKIEPVEKQEERVNLPLLYQALSDPKRDVELIAALAFRAANELSNYRSKALSGT